MRLIIRDSQIAASKHIAEYIIKRITSFAPSPSRPFVLGLPTGSSPILIYQHLVAAHREHRISFKHVITFNMDEYIGLPRAHPESYHSFMFTHFFAHIDIAPNNVHILNGNASDLAAECAAYEAKIKAVGGIELFLGGIGADGHIAFNEPGSSLASRTRVKTLAYETVLANARFFDGDVSVVPKMALTVGVGTIMEAREVVVIVTGAQKALALQKCVEAGVNHMFTLSALQMHPHSMIVCDEDATLELQVKTVKYFKSIEQVAAEFGSGQTDNSVLVAARYRSDSANEDMLEKTINGSLAPPAQFISRGSTPDLYPDNMASRVARTVAEPLLPSLEDLSFDRMGSRIESDHKVIV